MAEMIVPGTYIDVRAEGLISAGGVSTGIVGVIGTANAGPVGLPITLSGMSEANDLFGPPDPFSVPTNGSEPLTLTRSLQLAYGNGAATVVAVRVASPRASVSQFALKDASDRTVATLEAVTPGTWGNNIQISVDTAKGPARISNERQTSGFAALRYRSVQPGAQNRLQVVRGDTRRVDTFDIVYKYVARGETVARRSTSRAASSSSAPSAVRLQPSARYVSAVATSPRSSRSSRRNDGRGATDSQLSKNPRALMSSPTPRSRGVPSRATQNRRSRMLAAAAAGGMATRAGSSAGPSGRPAQRANRLPLIATTRL